MEEHLIKSYSGNTIQIYDEKFANVQKELANLASERKKKETPKGFIKEREIGDGKTAKYVERSVYQDALDREFPGWSVIDSKFWCDFATFTVNDADTKTSSTQSVPICFNASIIIQVVEKTGTIRRVPGVGTSTVSQKEMSRSNSMLLKQKYNIALTESYKVACGWLGLFFDLRADQEMIEDLYTTPSEEQTLEFNELIKNSPEETKTILRKRWASLTRNTAEDFLNNIKQKIKEKQQKESKQ